MNNHNQSLVSFDADLKKRLKDEKFRKGFEADKFRLGLALMIIRLRKQSKITQKVLAERLGTSQSSIARLESGQENLTIDTLGKIAATLNKNVKISFV